MQATPSVLLPGNYYDATRTPLKAHDYAPDFMLPLVEGSVWQPQAGVADEVKLSQLAGTHTASPKRVTLLVFWAFWCDTWKDVTHHLQTLRSSLQERQVQVVCVAVDASQQPVAQKAMESGLLWFPIGIDRHSQVTARYGVRRVPTLFVLDSKRRISTRFEGLPSDHRLLQAIRAATGHPVR